MKLLLFGTNGQVGRELNNTLLPLGELRALGRKEADLQNISHLRRVLDAEAPDVIINAAAYTAVDKAETDAVAVHEINSTAVNEMANYAQLHGSLFVHYSTDYVFDGCKSSSYLETDLTNPLNEYGRSKCAAEIAIIKSCCQGLILRTSWLYSVHGHNFIKTILRLAQECESLNVIADQYGTPTSAEFVANITAQIIKKYMNETIQSGIYHLTAIGETSWHNLACHIVQRAEKNGVNFKLNAKKIFPVSSDEYLLPAKRPQNSRLNTEFLSQTLGLTFPHWELDVNRVVDQLMPRGMNHET